MSHFLFRQRQILEAFRKLNHIPLDLLYGIDNFAVMNIRAFFPICYNDPICPVNKGSYVTFQDGIGYVTPVKCLKLLASKVTSRL